MHACGYIMKKNTGMQAYEVVHSYNDDIKLNLCIMVVLNSNYLPIQQLLSYQFTLLLAMFHFYAIFMTN
jgi:hypothetical protein